MIGHYIANFIMLSPKVPAEEILRVDRERGFGEAIDDYFNKWDKTPFSINSDDAVIRGEYILNPHGGDNPNKVVIIAHGITAAKEADIKYAKLFYDLGYNIIIFDERYFGTSMAKYCTLGMKEAEDIKILCDYAKELFGQDCILGLHGESMGGASVLRMLDTYKPDFVVADCPFSDLELLIKEVAAKRAGFIGTAASYSARLIGYLRYKYDYFKVKPIDSVKTADVPICFMHGSEDALISPTHSASMYELCLNPLSELHMFKADHALSFASDMKRYQRIIKEFVNKVENARNKGA